jgi:hypothetical protein
MCPLSRTLRETGGRINDVRRSDVRPRGGVARGVVVDAGSVAV